MENRGLDPVPDDERTGRVRTLFPTWVTANMTVLLLTVGAGLTVFDGLNFWQVLVVAVTAPVVSFGLVGLVSIAGKRGGAPGMALSRAVFGQRGNLFPGALLWVVRWGWETVNAVTGSYALLAVLDLTFGIRRTHTLTLVTLTAFVAASFLVSGLGIRALRLSSRTSVQLFGAASLLVLVHLIGSTSWRTVLDRPPGPSALMIAAIGTLAAGGISWVPSAPDFARYLPRSASGRGMVGAAVGGALVTVLPMVMMGAVMAVSSPHLAVTKDPVAFIGELLPKWISVPYLLTAVVGMALINAMSMYSAGFTAQTLGFAIPRAWAVGVNAAISLLLGGALMLVATSFIDTFLSFLTLLGVTFSAWLGVFGVDLLRGRTYDPGALMDTAPGSGYWYTGGFSPPAVGAWAAALVTGLLFTEVEWFSGPLAASWIGRHGLGWAATILVAAGVYAVLPRPADGTGGEPARF
ncbi:Purine-cytosine permease [Streptomyces sp. LamerLS-316]|uniref:purine-cytosine permease family protein n=1 Tax=unclassified Streptomyces TaxID=2593676 RepID=UPI000823F0A4|nr:cytosine permease [Streptomyces sp. LamerLS-316]MYQ37039.1 cytosine permease [Streptomyces sp. SID4921]SCK24283.1 Purine-cytosine permease [Streptomyces sp. LamerLS-316]